MAAQASPHSLLLQKHLLATPPPHRHTMLLLPHTVPLPLPLLPHIPPQSRRILLLSHLTTRRPPHIQVQATRPPPTTSPSSQLTTAASRRRRWRPRSVERLQNRQLDLMTNVG